jgi:hypothetical protein
MCAGRAVDSASIRTTLAPTTSMAKKLLRCRACRLTWFSERKAAAACPACGGKEVGATLELFHIGMVLIALAAIGWMRPLIAQVALGEGILPAAAALINAKKLTVDVERGVLKREDRRALVKDRRGNQVYVSSDELKRRQKAKKTRSKHVQR